MSLPSEGDHFGTTAHTGHAVQFYDSHEFIADHVGDYLAAGLLAGERVLAIATESHRNAFAAHLARRGCDPERACRSRQLTFLDARQTLAQFMAGDAPDADRFQATISAAIASSAQWSAHAPLRLYGEMVDLLCCDGNAAGAIRLEQLWNDFASKHELSLLCAYAMTSFPDAVHAADFGQICGQHAHVRPTERYAAGGGAARLRDISVLQQRARALETELRRSRRLERRLRRALAARRRAEEELKDFLENAIEGIHWVAADGRVLWANRAELELLGYSREEYIGRHIAEFHVDRSAIDDMLTRLARGERLDEYAARLRCKDGSVKHVLVSSNVLWRDGKFVHTRCFTRDVTTLKQAEVEREALLARERAAREEAEAANRAKADFLAVMSHELRTPLNAIAGYAELLELGIHGALTEAQRQTLLRIQRSQRHLQSLIESVLSFAKIESGKVEYRLADVLLDATLAGLEAMVTPQLEAKGLRYEYCRVDPAVTVRADREKLEQIVLNLLANAIKFTDTGSVTVSCDVGRDAVRIAVSDTGVGIDANKLELIFEPFVQAESSLTRSRHGAGLGLAISRNLARAMGGDITVASAVGAGSTFTLAVPRS